MSQARAVVFPEPRRVEIQSYDLPELEPDEILIKTEFSGISQGTELWAYEGSRPELQFPTVPGYQAIGRILETGKAVQGFQEGQRVMAKTNRLPSTFPETWMGAHASHLITKEVISVPEDCDPVGAAISTLSAVSLRGLRMIDINIGDTVVVLGQGLIGQASAQLARLRGAIVIVGDLIPQRLEASKQNGADFTVNVKEQTLDAFVAGLSPEGVDAVIETTGRSDLFGPCVDLLRWEGHLLLQGWYPKPISFDFHASHLKKPRVAVTCGFDFEDVAICLDLLRFGKLRMRELVSHLVTIDQAPQVYAGLAANDPSFLGVVFDWTNS